MERVYLDHVGSAPWRAGVREAYVEALAAFAHPSSTHREGQAARARLEEARTRAAAVLGCPPRELVFTSGGTEALRLGLAGLARARRDRSTRVLVSAIEHVAVRTAADDLAAEGFEVVRIPVGSDGRILLPALDAELSHGAACGAMIAAHHESGVVQPLAEVAARFESHGVPWLCDAALAPGRIAFDVAALGAPLCAFSGSKAGGPAGIGWLRVARGTRLVRSPAAAGIEEEGLRGGHVAVAAACAGAVALEDASHDRARRAAAHDAWIDSFVTTLSAARTDVMMIGARGSQLPGVRTLRLGNAHGDAVATALDVEGLAVAAGSPCALGGIDPFPGLLAMGLDARIASCTVRVSIGDDTLPHDPRDVARVFERVLTRIEQLGGHESSRSPRSKQSPL